MLTFTHKNFPNLTHNNNNSLPKLYLRGHKETGVLVESSGQSEGEDWNSFAWNSVMNYFVTQ